MEGCRRYLLWVARKEMDPDLQPKGGASDLVQETFLEAQRDFPQFKGHTEVELLAWLRRLLRNNLANFSRRYRDTAKRSMDSEVALTANNLSEESESGFGKTAASPSDRIIQQEELEAVQQAIVTLSEDHQRVIKYWCEGERSFEEIGRMMGRSPNAVRMLWFRAIEKLHRDLKAPE
jgi:RNA polymerase sigma-70 factor (ECF subfamily)